MSVLSIDFGTSFCAAAFLNAASQPEPVCFGVNQYNGKLYKFPTVIQYAKDEKGNEDTIIGEIALANLIQSNKLDSSIISKIKTELREQNGYYINGRIKCAVDILSDLFSKIKEIAENQKRISFDDVIVTHPAQYETTKQHILIEAAKKSGFSNVELVEEPIAASYAYIKKFDIVSEKGAIVFDYGGGTIDIAYLYYDLNKTISFKFPPRGRSECGGEYIDLLLHNYIHKVLGNKNNQYIIPILLEHCAKMKMAFSNSEKETIAFNGRAISLSKQQFEDIIRPKTDIALQLLRDVKGICENKHLPVDYIFLNGGSSRLSTIRLHIEEYFPDARIITYGEDDIAVAIGAVLYHCYMHNVSTIPQNHKTDKPRVVYETDSVLEEIRRQFKNR